MECMEQPSQQDQRHSSRSARLMEQTPTSSQVSNGHVTCMDSQSTPDEQLKRADAIAVFAADGDEADAPTTSVDREATLSAGAPAATREKEQAVGVGLCITDLHLH